jgi:ABC-type lipoprotein export system ATPase subunit
MTAPNTVVTRDLLVDYETAAGTVRALSHAGLTIDAGTSIAIMGPSGCGKSTLLGLLAGLAVPTQGTVVIGDTTISSLPEPARVRFRQRALGMVYQADNLLPHLTVEENVALPLAISRPTAGPGAPADDPGRLLERLGMGELVHRFPDQLSGGQRQRVAVARAIVHRPMVILADEPTGALDDDNALGVITLLTEVQRDIAATLILVTHDPAIAAHADRIEHLTRPRPAREMADVG